MPKHQIPYAQTGFFSKLICDYLAQKESTSAFYNRFSELANFKEQLAEKSIFSQHARGILAESLTRQYKGFEISESVSVNIKSLEDSHTFTVTTGHQLNLFTGPLYFLYKIVHAVTLSRKLKQEYPDYDFVPVYWMATEDHDFEEIHHFRLNGKIVNWNRPDIKNNNKGAVGNLDTQGLDAVYTHICAELGHSKNAKYLCDLFESAYLKHDNLADATRYLANALFGEYGLVIVDGNDAALKQLFAPYMKAELIENKAFDAVNKQAEALVETGYHAQVNPREINLFYLSDGLRERIVEQNGDFVVNETTIRFTQAELLQELEQHPEHFSPNVIMRPLYQEVILPNLCYIGGGGELAYWLELKTYFERVAVPFPILMLRNSALILSEKQFKKANKLKLSLADLFKNQNDLVNQKIRSISNIHIDLTPQREQLVKQFEDLLEIASQTDASFLGAVKAQQVKQLKGIDNLEKRLLKAQRIKLGDQVKRLTLLQDQLFPEQSLQERKLNFSELYLEYGYSLIELLMRELDPENKEFTVLIA